MTIRFHFDMHLHKVVKGYGYRSLAQFRQEFNLTRATIDYFRRDSERFARFMKEVEKIKLPKGATHVDINTGQFYKKGRFGFIFWHDKKHDEWSRCNRDDLKGLDKIKFYEYEG